MCCLGTFIKIITCLRDRLIWDKLEFHTNTYFFAIVSFPFWDYGSLKVTMGCSAMPVKHCNTALAEPANRHWDWVPIIGVRRQGG